MNKQAWIYMNIQNRIKNTLASRDLFILPTKNVAYNLLYAPLADSIMLLNKTDIQRLATAVSDSSNADNESIDIINSLCDVASVKDRDGHVRTEKDFINLSILPNNTCNFSCSYCYSAKGRSTKKIDYNSVKQAIDYFLSPDRNQSSILTVTYFGGGEPLLSWKDIVEPSINYLYEQADRLQRKVITTIITNGSLIPTNFIKICKTHNIDLVCSFDILEDIQNAQRRHYQLVKENISSLIQNKVIPAINSVITPLNICKQKEMIIEVHGQYPEIKYIAFEPTVDYEKIDKKQFYSDFLREFLLAQQLAQEFGIVLTCSSLRNVDVTVDRYCAGEMALCADGSLSICPCISSPYEPNYQYYLYGKVDSVGVHINREKLKGLLAINVHINEWCKECFAKWTCGGGCMNKNLLNSNSQDIDYCLFTRQFLQYVLTKRLDQLTIEETGNSIKQIVGDYEYFFKK